MIIDKNKYKEEINIIMDACDKFNGEVVLSNISYELARFNSNHGDIIFYQHTNKNSSKSIRCRINKIKSDVIADVVIWLQENSGINNTFSVKNISQHWTKNQRRKALLKK